MKLVKWFGPRSKGLALAFAALVVSSHAVMAQATDWTVPADMAPDAVATKAAGIVMPYITTLIIASLTLAAIGALVALFRRRVRASGR